MLAPNPRRPLSRSSIATTFVDSSPPSSWSEYGNDRNMPRSNRTSLTSVSVDGLSDNGTEMPELGFGKDKDRDIESVTAVGRDERPLIDFGDDDEEDGSYHQEESYIEETGIKTESLAAATPGDKLRMLLRQMELEVRDTVPPPPAPPAPIRLRSVSPVPEILQSGWRNGRRLGLNSAERRNGTSSSHEETEEEVRGEPSSPAREEELEDDSPPTPPLRITNPYLARRSSDKQKSLSPQTAPRLPSRAAVLRNSTSSSQASGTPSVPPPSRTPLETFIATHHSPPAFQPTTSDPSSSRSHEDRSNSNSSTSSRKGKERAQPVQNNTQAAISPRRQRFHTPTSPAQYGQNRRWSHTPRRFSVELAPDDMELFAQEAGSLEVQGEVELDLEETSGDPPWEGDIEESTVEEYPEEQDEYLSTLEKTERTERTERTVRARSNDLSGSRGSLNDSSRLSRVLSHSRESPPEETSLPALPEPSLDGSDDSDHAPNTLSSRQASLFRSPSRSSPRQNSPSISHVHSRSFSRHSLSPNLSRVRDMEIPPQEPIHVGMVHTSTPTRVSANTTLSGATPHPPGRWFSPAKGRGSVHFSPRKNDPAPASPLKDTSGDMSIHRLRLSPAKSPAKKSATISPAKAKDTTASGDAELDEGNSSFLGRIPGLSRMVTKSHRSSIPPPSTTLQEARDALAYAAKTSAAARIHVENTQRQWLEAIAAAQSMNGVVVGAVKRGWGWGSWAWWVAIEMLLVWGVFRVTLDYASSAHYIASIDPFSFQAGSSSALSIPLPSAISTFIVPHRGSANFFDLLERADLWRRFEELGLLSLAGVGAEGVFAGVVGRGMRGLGGVPT